LKIWALVFVVGFALLAVSNPFYKKKKSWCHGVYPDGLNKSSLFKRVDVMQPSLGTMRTFLGAWLHCFLPALSRFRRLSSLTSFHEMSTK
jgi:hypothetical protein